MVRAENCSKRRIARDIRTYSSGSTGVKTLQKAMLGRNAFARRKLAVPFASLAISAASVRTLRSPTARIRHRITRPQRENRNYVGTARMCALSGAMGRAHRHCHARSLRTSPENPPNLRLGGGEGGIRTLGTGYPVRQISNATPVREWCHLSETPPDQYPLWQDGSVARQLAHLVSPSLVESGKFSPP